MTLSSPGTSKVARRIDTHLVFVQRSRKRKHRDKKKLESCDVRLLKCQKCTLGKTTLTNIKKHPKTSQNTRNDDFEVGKMSFFSFSDFGVFWSIFGVLEYPTEVQEVLINKEEEENEETIYFPGLCSYRP